MMERRIVRRSARLTAKRSFAELEHDDGVDGTYAEDDEVDDGDVDEVMADNADDEVDDDDAGDEDDEDDEEDSDEDGDDVVGGDNADDEVVEFGPFFDHNTMLKLRTYDGMKRYFEKYIVKVSGDKGYAMKSQDCGGRLIKEIQLKTEFGDCHYGDQDESFIKRWIKDSDKRVATSVTFDPTRTDDTRAFNLYLGFSPGIKRIENPEKDLLFPWRTIGIQLCEGDAVKFKLLEEWLAHLIQHPGERTNVSFAFLGAKQGTFKNAFFAPIKSIIGDSNFLESANIHHIVDTGNRQHKAACKLLCILDEATKKTTSKYQSQLKVAVTGETSTIHRAHEHPLRLPAHHRLVVLSNFIDGLGVDFASTNRRFIMFKPTDVMKRLSPGATKKFTEEYVKRFVNPGDTDYINVLYTHLATLNVTRRSTADWEEAQRKMMEKSQLMKAARHPPPHAVFLFNFTRPEPGDISFAPYQVANGIYKFSPSWDNDPEPDEYDTYFDVVISRVALWSLYVRSGVENPLTRSMFARWINQVLVASVDTGVHFNNTAPPSVSGKRDSGTRTWNFKTRDVHGFLRHKFPELLRTDTNDNIVTKVQEIEDEIMFS